MTPRTRTLTNVALLLGIGLVFFFVRTGSVLTTAAWSRPVSVNASAGEGAGPALNATQTSQSYILRAWEFDTDRGAYMWSLEIESDHTSPKTLYHSLDSPAIRTKVASLSTGAKIVFDFRDGGSFQSTDEITGKGYKTFLEFAQFCKSKHIDFKFSMVAN